MPSDAAGSGLLWFFDRNNWEMLVKVVNGCGFNDRFWVFSAATTNVEYTLRVVDTLSGDVQTYFNPLGTSGPAITDTGAFDTCDAVASATAASVGVAPVWVSVTLSVYSTVVVAAAKTQKWFVKPLQLSSTLTSISRLFGLKKNRRPESGVPKSKTWPLPV